MKQRLYIVPGFGETTKDKPYQKIKRIAKEMGYDVTPINVPWNYKTMSNWVATARAQLSEQDIKNSTILGFSFGAMIALELSKEFGFKRLILCSPSPYFQEDLKFIPKASKIWLGKRRFKDFKKYSFPKQSKAMEVVFMIGEEDWSFAQKRVKERYRRRRGSKSLEMLKGIDHDISHPTYLEAITKQLQKGKRK